MSRALVRGWLSARVEDPHPGGFFAESGWLTADFEQRGRQTPPQRVPV